MRAATARPLIIAIDGRSGAGKTTLAVELTALLRRHRTVSLFHLEELYPGWDGLAAGVSRYVEQVLTPLSAGEDAAWTAWDWAASRAGATHTTAVADIVVVEGVGAAHASALSRLDVVIWVEAPQQHRKHRALARDGAVYAPFWDRWAAQEQALLGDAVPAAADIVLDGAAAPDPVGVLAALAELPNLEAALAPELARRRGLEFTAERLDAYPPAPELFAALYGTAAEAIWLDSSLTEGAGGGAERARFSIMADAGGSFGRVHHHTDGVNHVRAGAVTHRIRAPFFRWLDANWGRKAVRAPAHYPGEFTLGWLGYLGYELKGESGGAPTPTEPGLPAASLLFAGRAVVFDHAQRCLFLLTLAEAQQPASQREAAQWREQVRALLTAGLPDAAGTDPGPAPPAPVFAVRDTAARYRDMIAAAREQIYQGNSYEVCLTTRLTAHTASPLDPWRSYLALRRRNPAPFAAYVRLGPVTLASTSPERFLRLNAAGALRAEPIKGTRPRGTDPARDAALRAELAGSLKDRAENVMIVDLLRNDLSHFAVPGSVTVPRLCAVESYATVHQLVSTIDAQLAPGSSRAQALAAAFPAGSMTGAPKISTMAILDALESGPRGAYAGCIGYFSLNAALDLSVTIRTLVLRDTADGGTQLTLGVGGAITADSEADAEWAEVQAKAFGVLSALGGTFPA